MTTIYGKEKVTETQSPETESPAEFLINHSIQNFLFLVQPLFPSGLSSIKEKGRLKSSRTLQGPLRYRSPSMFPVSYL